LIGFRIFDGFLIKELKSSPLRRKEGHWEQINVLKEEEQKETKETRNVIRYEVSEGDVF
jgi:hypothetical protein